jgi:hypothetical protein
MTRRLVLLLPCLVACASVGEHVVELQRRYADDTVVAERLLGEQGLERPRGQVTFSLTSRFAEKLLRASLHPNQLKLSVAAPGRAWRQEVSKLGLKFDNGLWLDSGDLLLSLAADGLVFQGDRVTMRATVEGRGQLAARLKFYGIPLQRNVEVTSRFSDPLEFELARVDDQWLLKPAGAPLKVHVEVQLPALTLGGHSLLATTFARDLEWPVERLRPFPLPVPAPRTVRVGATELQLALVNLAVGSHDDRLWFGTDLVASLPVAAPAAPAAQAAPATTEAVAPTKPH